MYGTVALVQRAFNPDQWDPATDQPDETAVEGLLEEESSTLDGRIAHIVTVPVSDTVSPRLHGVLTRIVVLRVQATVHERLFVGKDGLEQAKAWRDEAERLVKGVYAGATADGVALGGRSPERPGPVAAADAPEAVFTREDRW